MKRYEVKQVKNSFSYEAVLHRLDQYLMRYHQYAMVSNINKLYRDVSPIELKEYLKVHGNLQISGVMDITLEKDKVVVINYIDDTTTTYTY